MRTQTGRKKLLPLPSRKLEKQGFKQSKHDACLFIHPKMIVLVYVDDCIFFAPNKQDILTMLNNLRKQGLKMEPE